jgi:hypothetical protein
MKVYEIAWAPPIMQELIAAKRPECQERLRARAAEVVGSRNERTFLKLRIKAVIAYGRRGIEDSTVFSATPLGIERYVLSLLILRQYFDEPTREWIQPWIDELLEIAEQTREVRIGLWKLQQDLGEQ